MGGRGRRRDLQPVANVLPPGLQAELEQGGRLGLAAEAECIPVLKAVAKIRAA